MDSINLLSVAKSMLHIIRNKYDYEDKAPNDEEEIIAELLLDKLCELIHDYVFVEDEVLDEGNVSKYIKFM